MRSRAVMMRTVFIFTLLMLALLSGAPGLARASSAQMKLAPLAPRDSGQLNVHLQQLIPNGFNQLVVYMSVVDADGHPVAGLTANQVAVSIDAQPPVQPQELTEVTDVSEPITAAVLLDTSTTMGFDDKLPAAKAAIKAFGQSLNAQDQVAFYQIAGTGPAGVKRLLNFTTDHAQLDAVVDPLQAGKPGTRAPIYDALYQVAQDMAPLSGRKLIVLQTDQHDDGSIHSLTDALDLVKQVHLPIYTIGLGADADQSTLQEMSRATGGTSFANPDSTTLSASYQSILSQLRNLYRLTIQSSPFSVGTHHVQVQVTYQNVDYKDPPDPVDLNDQNGPGVFVVPRTSLSLNFSLKSGVQVSGPTSLSVDVVGGDLPIRSVSVMINGKLFTTLQGSGHHFQFTWNTRYLLPGTYKLHITATDIVGDQATPLDLTVQVGLDWPYWIVTLIELLLIIAALVVLRYAYYRFLGGRLEGILIVRNGSDQKAEVELGHDVHGSRIHLKIMEEGIVIGAYPLWKKKVRFEGPAKPIPETYKTTKKGGTARVKLFVRKERMEAGARRIPVPYYQQRGKKKPSELKSGMSKRAGNYRVDFTD